MINLKKLDELNLIEQLNTVIDMSLELKEIKAPDFIINYVESMLDKAVFILNKDKASDEYIDHWVMKCLVQAHGCYFAYTEMIPQSYFAKLKETTEELYSRKKEINKMAGRY